MFNATFAAPCLTTFCRLDELGLVRAGAGADLLAFRALSNQRVTTIASVDADGMGAWRRGDDAVIRKLAALELEASGVRSQP